MNEGPIHPDGSEQFDKKLDQFAEGLKHHIETGGKGWVYESIMKDYLAEKEDVSKIDVLNEWLKSHHYSEVIVSTNIESETTIAKEMIGDFKNRHSLEALSSIVELGPTLFNLFYNDRDMTVEQREKVLNELAPELAEYYRIRTAAKADCDVIYSYIQAIYRIPTITKEERDVLHAEWMTISRPVGMIVRDTMTIDHNR